MILHLKPHLSEKIWGGAKLAEYGYELPSNKTGEAWVISAHKHGSSTVIGGKYDGVLLRELYETNRELFANDPSPEFPLLGKILDANDDLSIQIHPDDVYAREFENSLGKTECWYVLDTTDDNHIIIGHNGTVEDARVFIDKGEWNHLLRKHPVKEGDFFSIPAGTIHAICAGTLIYEMQQSSDVTYRLYDYDRLENGLPRELHLKQSAAVLKGFEEGAINTRKRICDTETLRHELLVENAYFKVDYYKVNGKLELSNTKYLLVSITGGEGLVNGEVISKGSNFIVSSDTQSVMFEGNLELFVTEPKHF